MSAVLGRAGVWLPPSPGAPATARRLVRVVAERARLRSSVTEAALAIVDELVSNAVQHPTPPGPIHLSLRHTGPHPRMDRPGRWLDIAVHDPDIRLPHLSTDPQVRHGLNLVDVLAADWGVDRGEVPGKTVWARLSTIPTCPPPPSTIRQPDDVN